MASAELLLFLPALSQPSTVHYGLIPNGLTRFASNSLNEPENASQLACAANEAVGTARVRIPARNHAARVRCESCPTGASGPRTQSKPHLRHCMDRGSRFSAMLRRCRWAARADSLFVVIASGPLRSRWTPILSSTEWLS